MDYAMRSRPPHGGRRSTLRAMALALDRSKSIRAQGALLRGLGHGALPARMERGHEILQAPRRDRLAQPRHQPLVMAEVVHGGELAAEDLVAAVEMAQVGAAETIRAGMAVAALLDHPGIGGVFRVADAQRALGGEQEAVARV